MGVAWEEQEAICSSNFLEFESSLVQEFELLWEFCEVRDFGVLQSLLRDLLCISHWMVRKIVLYAVVLHIHYYNYYYHS